jgi:hypothetical protein
MSHGRRWLFVGMATMPILLLTLRPAGGTVAAGWTLAFSGPEALAEILQNLLLFTPFGAALVLADPGRKPGENPILPATLLGAALSFAVEFIQQWIPGRDPNVGDIVCNTISTAIGAGLVWTAPRWLFVPPRQAAWQALALALVACGAWLVSGWLLAHPAAARALTLDDVRGRGLSLGDGWRLIFSPNFPRALIQLLDACWIGGWVLGIGYWAGRTGRAGRAVGIASVVIAVTGLLVIPGLVGVRMMSTAVIVGAVAGIGVGWLLSRLAAFGQVLQRVAPPFRRSEPDRLEQPDVHE